MSGSTPAVNPHPLTSATFLARIGDHLLLEYVRLSRSRRIPADRLRLAGVPPLDVLETELRRRERLGLGVAA